MIENESIERSVELKGQLTILLDLNDPHLMDDFSRPPCHITPMLLLLPPMLSLSRLTHPWKTMTMTSQIRGTSWRQMTMTLGKWDLMKTNTTALAHKIRCWSAL